jgi:hypothetical protein
MALATAPASWGRSSLAPEPFARDLAHFVEVTMKRLGPRRGAAIEALDERSGYTRAWATPRRRRKIMGLCLINLAGKSGTAQGSLKLKIKKLRGRIHFKYNHKK